MIEQLQKRKVLIILSVLMTLCITTIWLTLLFMQVLIPPPEGTPYPSEFVSNMCDLFETSSEDEFCRTSSLSNQNFDTFRDAVRRWFPIPETSYGEVIQYLENTSATGTCIGGEFTNEDVRFMNICPQPTDCIGGIPECTFQIYPDFYILLRFDRETSQITTFNIQGPSASN